MKHKAGVPSMLRNLSSHLAALVIFVLLKLAYTQADTDDLAFLLKPTDWLVSLTANSPSGYQPESGYYHADLNILIDKSCSGFNFWILCFLMLSFLALGYFTQPVRKLATLPVALLAAYALTILANTSRISIALLLQHQSPGFSQHHPGWFHEAQGIFVYLSCLIGTYLAAESALTQLTRPHAQPA